MKAAVYWGNETIRVEEVEVREPEANEVIVEVKACGVCGTDLHIYAGAKGAADCTPPTVLGHEFAGVVHKLGANVTDYKVGDRVCIDPNDNCGTCYYCRVGKAHFCEHMNGIGTTVNGGFAQYCTVPAKQLYHLADSLSFAEGAMAEPTACCLNGIDKSNIRPGDTVAVIGGGTIGQIMLRLARLAGAANLILIEPVESKRQLALANGVNLVIDPRTEDAREVIAHSFLKQVDVVIECVGLPVTMEQAIDLTGKGGTTMLFGLTNPDSKIPFAPFEAFQKELTISTSFINPYTQERAVALLNSGTLKVSDLITDQLPLADINQVFENAEYRSHGKIVILP